MSDGAAYRPATDEWWPIAPAPAPIEPYTTTAAMDGDILLQTPEVLLRYDLDADRWSSHLPPPSGSIMAAGDRLVAISGTDEISGQPDWVHDAAADEWRQLPEDPLGPSFDRQMVWTGGDLLLLASSLDPARQNPTFVEAARLRDPFRAAAWEVLPGSTVLSGWGAWLSTPWGIVNAAPGGADGGQVNGFGRTLPFGGVLRLDPPRWRGLPPRPEATDRLVGTGAATSGRTLVTGGWALDLEIGEWATIPHIEELPAQGYATGWAGDRLLLVGGGAFADDGFGFTATDTAWVWLPPWHGADPAEDPTPVALPTPEPYERPAPDPDERDGIPDCPSAATVETTYPLADGGGAPDPSTALHQALAPLADRHGGEVVIRNESYASLVADNQELVTAAAVELPDGSWTIRNAQACHEDDLPQ